MESDKSNKSKGKSKSFVVDVAVGTMSTAISIIPSAPLDRVKILLQTQHANKLIKPD